jgi:hypothetical protein
MRPSWTHFCSLALSGVEDLAETVKIDGGEGFSRGGRRKDGVRRWRVKLLLWGRKEKE